MLCGILVPPVAYAAEPPRCVTPLTCIDRPARVLVHACTVGSADPGRAETVRGVRKDFQIADQGPTCNRCGARDYCDTADANDIDWIGLRDGRERVASLCQPVAGAPDLSLWS